MNGQVIGGRYKIIQQLARGGFGDTFLACDIQLQENPKCVVKLFKPLTTDSGVLQQAKRLFEQEAKILQTLGSHDQIPQFIAHFEENQEFYLVQEYIEGYDISEELPPKGNRLNQAETIKLLQEILEVLAFVHEHNVIHRDIKPSNIRRRQDGKIVLIDFGAVKQITTQYVKSQGETAFTIPIGTPGYMPSEQAAGKPTFSSDIYAMGILAIQAMTGIIPHQKNGRLPTDPNTGEILWRDLIQIHPEFGNVIDKMVRYDFRQRYPTAELASLALHSLSLTSFFEPQFQTDITAFPNPQQDLGQQETLIKNKRYRKFFKTIGTIAIATITITVGIFTYINQKSENFLVYTDPINGFNIKYPANWQKIDKENPVTQEVVSFLPKESNKDTFQENVTVRVEEFPGNLQDSMKEFVKETTNNVPNSQIYFGKANAIKLGTQDANKLIFTSQEGNTKLTYLQVWTIKNNQLYVITYAAETDDYQKFVDTAEKMINSFEIN
jgi:eukaryotic-like serine/threonine-protein kinase